MKPELTVSIVFLLLATTGYPSIRLEGWTHSNAAFEGYLSTVDKGFMYLINDDKGSLGIPVQDITALRLKGAEPVSVNASDILRFEDILHLWHPQVLSELLAYAEHLGDTGEWSQCYRSANRIENCSNSLTIRDAATELKAFALFQLGLKQQCGNVLESYQLTKDILELTSRTCWLMAQLSVEAKDYESACRWGLIPKLKIPSEDSDLANALYQSCQVWQNLK